MKAGSIFHSKSLMTSIVVMLIISLAMVPIVAEADITAIDTYFSVDPITNIEGYTTCNSFTVDINITDAPESYAWNVKLVFDNDTLHVTGVSEGPWLQAAGTTDFYYTPLGTANAAGEIGIGCSLRGAVSGSTGNGVLCTITLHVESDDVSPLDLQDTVLIDMDLDPTEYPNNDGFFQATGAANIYDVAIIDVKADATQVNQGTTVTITVDVENEGDFNQLVNVSVYGVYEFCGSTTEEYIGSNSTETINSGATLDYEFDWNTAGVAGENYTIKTVVEYSPADQDPHDDVFLGPAVRVVCPDDVKVTDVELLTPVVHDGDTAEVNVTVVNEGSNAEGSVTVEVYANASKVYTSSAFSLAVGETKTIEATWTATGTGIYTIKGKVPAVSGEVAKNLNDNEKVDGTLTVVYDDVGVTSITITKGYPLITPYRWAESTVIRVTAVNTGTEYARFDIFVWADPTPGAPNSGDEMLLGQLPGGALGAGDSHTFTGLEPYGTGINWSGCYGPTSLLYLNTHTLYTVFANITKLYGPDQNAANNLVSTTLNVTNVCGDTAPVLDNMVTGLDQGFVGTYLWSAKPGPPWHDNADLNGDGLVTGIDQGIVGTYLWTFYPPTCP